jgi:hypothetical protein
MYLLIFAIGGVIAGTAAGSILLIQQYRVSRGSVVLDPDYNGPANVSITLHAIIRYALKRSVYMRKFLMQYVAHLAVRVMFYVDKLSTAMYARSRNWFVKNAVQNKGTVPHFWQHLKVYKQEMDQEKEEKGLDK